MGRRGARCVFAGISERESNERVRTRMHILLDALWKMFRSCRFYEQMGMWDVSNDYSE